MTTSPSSGLSPEAKEFVPFVQIPAPPLTTIPLYIAEKTVTSIYSSEQQQQQQPLIYPLMKFPEIEFRLQPTQSFHINSNNQSQSSASGIVLVPTTGCYPNTSLLYSTNNPSSNFYPVDYPEQSIMNYSLQQPKSTRISSFYQQRGMTHSSYRSNNQQNSHYDQQETKSFPTRGNFRSTNSKRISRGSHSHSIQQQHDEQKKENLNYQIHESNYHMNGDDISFKLRAEDFPSLPINNQQLKKKPSQALASTDTRPTPSWNKVVSTPRAHSTSPHSIPKPTTPTPDQRPEQNHSSKKKSSSNLKKSSTQPMPSKNTSKIPITPEQPRSQSVASNDGSIKEQKSKTDDGFSQTKQQQKRAKQRKNKVQEEPPALPLEQVPEPKSIPFALDDVDAFPVLGQEVSISTTKKSENNSTAKDTSSTAGLISKAKIKANHGYQIRLQDMFNALSTSTQTKQQNSQNKSSSTLVSGANPLDSNPAPKRGKEREQPKPRKPTKLKRIITKELEENQKHRQQSLVKSTTIKQTDDTDNPDPTDIDDDVNNPSINNLHVNRTDYTSASCTEEDSNNDTDDDEIPDHEPTSQLQTPYAHQMPQSNIKQQIHDAGFREYCSQLIDRQLDKLCVELLIKLKGFQDRKKQQFQANPERARRKRRFVHGIREVTKHLRLQRLKCVLIAPDCQSIQSEGGLDDAIEHIIDLCKEQNILYVFTLNRQKLGRCLRKDSRISTIGIFDYSGADQIYKQILETTNENQRAYKQILDNITNHEETTTPSHGLNSREFYKILHRTFQQQNQQRQQIVNNIPNESLSKMLPKVPAHYAHSRQTSDTSTIYIDPQLINSMKKQHTRASSGTFELGKISTNKKNHQRTLSDGAAAIDDTSTQIKHHSKTHSRTPSGCSAISQIEQQDYFEQSKNILINNNNNNNNNNDEIFIDNEENRLKSIHEDTEESSANIKRKNVEKWINDN